MAALEFLTLSVNRIFGTIPPEFATGLTSLLSLNLNDNKLVSPIPKLGNLPSLGSLLLDSNQFRGPLSGFFFNESVDSSLVILSASHNFFSGSLPHSLYLLVKITQLDFSSNFLFGTLSDMIGNLRLLQYLKLSNNGFEGTIPDAFDTMCNTSGSDGLINIILHSNRFEGSLPSSLRSCSSTLTIADFSSNNFQGSIPTPWGDLVNLDTLDLSHCALEGTVPAAVLALPNITHVNLRSNRLVGSLPSFSSTIINMLDLSSNSFSGTFDLLRPNFGPTVVNVSNNMLTGLLQPQPEFIVGVGVSLLEVSMNAFLCPFPLYSPSVLLQRSPCWHPWSLYMIYIGGSIASALLVAVLLRFSFLARILDHIKSCIASRSIFIFFLSWSIACASLFFDIKSWIDMCTYLTQPIDNCAPSTIRICSHLSCRTTIIFRSRKLSLEIVKDLLKTLIGHRHHIHSLMLFSTA